MAFPKSYAFLVPTLLLGSLHVVFAMNYAMFNSPDSKFMMRWTFDGNKLMFNITCKATGWCAVGFTTGNGAGMMNYDIAAGGVANNQPYLADYWSTTTGSPPRDATQNFMLTGGTEAGEYTSIQFERYPMTGDTSNDVQFGFDTRVTITWAMHTTSDITSERLSPRHDVRERSSMMYNLIAEALAAKPLGMSISSPNGKFMMSWMYNGTKLVVNSTCQTSGWCAVGFTTTADGKGMVNYDIALGGVKENMTTYLYDYWSNSTVKPTEDGQQDLMLINASEANGYTSVQFARDAMTGDNRDVQLAADTDVWIVWAMGMADANSSTEFSKHNYKGIIMPNKVNLLKGMVVMPTTTSPPTTTEATTTTKAPADVVKSCAMFVAMLAAIVPCLLSL